MLTRVGIFAIDHALWIFRVVEVVARVRAVAERLDRRTAAAAQCDLGRRDHLLAEPISKCLDVDRDVRTVAQRMNAPERLPMHLAQGLRSHCHICAGFCKHAGQRLEGGGRFIDRSGLAASHAERRHSAGQVPQPLPDWSDRFLPSGWRSGPSAQRSPEAIRGLCEHASGRLDQSGPGLSCVLLSVKRSLGGRGECHLLRQVLGLFRTARQAIDLCARHRSIPWE